MFTTVRVNRDTKELPRIMALYRHAFPANERCPLDMLLDDRSGSSDFLAFYEEEAFCGFVCLLSHGDLTHILYLAIEEEMRGKGYGTRALEAVRAARPGQRVLADIELDSPRAANREQREKRRQFYLRSGYRETEVRYSWRHESYEILAQGGTLTEEEFDAFWRYFEENTPLQY